MCSVSCVCILHCILHDQNNHMEDCVRNSHSIEVKSLQNVSIVVMFSRPTSTSQHSTSTRRWMAARISGLVWGAGCRTNGCWREGPAPACMQMHQCSGMAQSPAIEDPPCFSLQRRSASSRTCRLCTFFNSANSRHWSRGHWNWAVPRCSLDFTRCTVVPRDQPGDGSTSAFSLFCV